MKTTFIYTLSEPWNEDIIRYIGKSNNPALRLKGHMCEKGDYYKCNWLKELKKQELKPILKIIDEVPANTKEEWGFWEQYYISLYKSWGFNLTNDPKCLGGEGFDVPWNKGLTRETDFRVNNIAKLKEGTVLSPETKKKKRESMLGKQISAEQRKKMSQSQKKRHFKTTSQYKSIIADKVWKTRRENGTDSVALEVRQKIAKTLLGTKQSEESKRKKSLALKGKRKKPLTEEHKRNMSIAIKKALAEKKRINAEKKKNWDSD